MLFPRFPHKLSDGQLGLMLLVIIPVIFGLFWLYNRILLTFGPDLIRLIFSIAVLLVAASCSLTR